MTSSNNEANFLSSLSTDHLEFIKDPRVALDNNTGRYIIEDEETGLEYEFNTVAKQWIPILNEQAIKLQRKAYLNEGEEVEDLTEEDWERIKEERKRNKRRKPNHNEENTSQEDKKKSKKMTNEKQKKPIRNTAVYVSNLPIDTTEEELEDVFSKYGVIAEDLITGKKKIRLYRDKKTNNFKGDALVVYFREESVHLAIEMLDDSTLRIEDTKNPVKIKVQKADFSHKQTENGGEYKKDVIPERSLKEKKAIQKRFQKLHNKLEDWDDDDDVAIKKEKEKDLYKRWDKVVILKHVFTLDELENDENAANDIEEDIRTGCNEIGEVKNTVLFDLESEGVVSVRFSTKEEAIKCIQKMNGRFFGGRTLEASLYDGVVKYRKKKDENSGSRAEKFGDWLENEE